MNETHSLKIYIDRLKNDDTEEIYEQVENEFLEVSEKELIFVGKVTVVGRAYLANTHLILDFKIKSVIQMPCSICNEKVEKPHEINDFSHSIELNEIPSAVFDYSDEIRSALLLNLPQFIECHQNHCPRRKDLSKYLKKKTDEAIYPFQELNF